MIDKPGDVLYLPNTILPLKTRLVVPRVSTRLQRKAVTEYLSTETVLSADDEFHFHTIKFWDHVCQDSGKRVLEEDQAAAENIRGFLTTWCTL